MATPRRRHCAAHRHHHQRATCVRSRVLGEHMHLHGCAGCKLPDVGSVNFGFFILGLGPRIGLLVVLADYNWFAGQGRKAPWGYATRKKTNEKLSRIWSPSFKVLWRSALSQKECNQRCAYMYLAGSQDWLNRARPKPASFFRFWVLYFCLVFVPTSTARGCLTNGWLGLVWLPQLLTDTYSYAPQDVTVNRFSQTAPASASRRRFCLGTIVILTPPRNVCSDQRPVLGTLWVYAAVAVLGSTLRIGLYGDMPYPAASRDILICLLHISAGLDFRLDGLSP
ncbi:hypothetical protein BDN70DRAFT_509370 [Pholiota conissans]|uniref:Uncharacterized protein n=1 Tax=Pholiota conissans TaxID=109636 RepID=A0A9P6CMR1_9AGAR|nr:hypothetical protein BDN70DRAFT_509370 [Pholiota conissans]